MGEARDTLYDNASMNFKTQAVNAKPTHTYTLRFNGHLALAGFPLNSL